MYRSFWLEQALAGTADDPNPLRGAVTSDVAIVGGGFVGLWTALMIKRLDPGVDVCVIEADVCGGGAPGRCGGLVMTWWPKIASLMRLFGADEALRLVRASEVAIEEIENFCSEHAPEAEFRRGGWLWTATTGAQLGAWDKVVIRAEALAPGTFRRPDPREVARRSGSPQHLAGVIEPSNATVQPAALVRAIRSAGLRAVQSHTHRPRYHRDTDHRTRHNARPKVVIATNAWAAALRPLRNKLFVISSDMIATEPIADRLDDIGWTQGEAITDSQTLVCYYRTTAEGRIAFGKGGGSIGFDGHIRRAMHHNASRASIVVRDFRRYYPMLRTVKLTHDWAGPIDRTMNSLPLFGRLYEDANIYYGVGWSGNGVGPSVVGGKILAALALGHHNEWSGCGLITGSARSFPPEPIRFVGAHIVKEAIRRKEDAEALEKRPPRLAVALPKLAPTGLER
jgi:glycine/D-amino acid oxidase-like deaminating enzyme